MIYYHISDIYMINETLKSEWNLVCDHAYDATYPDTLYMGGMAVSMVLMGSVSDNYGRQRTCLWCQVKK